MMRLHKALTNFILIALTLSILMAVVATLHAADPEPAVKDKDHQSEGKAAHSKYINFDPAKSSTYFLYPVMFYVNTAFDSAQCPAAFPQHDYFINHVKLFNEIKNPVRAINRTGGFGKFFQVLYGTVPEHRGAAKRNAASHRGRV
jgi:hypothetical protein